LTDFLGNFISNHVKRSEVIPGFPLEDFLVLLYKYTFQQASSEAFAACLGIWDTFVEYVLHEYKGSNDGKLGRFEQGLVMVAQHVFRKTQFSQRSQEPFHVADEYIGHHVSNLFN
jgi:hypothetical protein